MKKRFNAFKRAFCMLLAALLLICGIPFVAPAVAEENADADGYRVLLSSDMHYSIASQAPYTVPSNYYGVTNDDRLQLWVDSIKAEHQLAPIDLLIIPGDVSFDYCDSRGTMTQLEQSTVDTFVEKYVSQLPEEIDIFIMPGNHDAWTNANWSQKTGYPREGYLTLGDNLFIMVDTYDNPDSMEDNYGVGDNMTYQPIDVAWVQEIMDTYPTYNVWLISHYFDSANESDDFKALVKDNARVKGLFAGHTHQSELISLGADYGNKAIAQTGNFAYSYYTAYPTAGTTQDLLDAMWGHRELVITSDSAYSQYILADTTDMVGLTPPDAFKERGVSFKQERRTAHRINYYNQAQTETNGWYQANASELLIDSAEDMIAFANACTAQNGYLAGKTVKLTADVDMTECVWTPITNFQGVFDGQTFAIRNLTMIGGNSVALFAELKNATVKNLRVIGGELKGVKDVAVLAVIAKGECHFQNVYTEMRVTATSSRASGMISYVNADKSKAVFEDCVSNCTFKGQRSGGLIAQVMINSFVELTDCAFIGDLSKAGAYSAGLTGLTTGSATLMRCVSLGKGSTYTESGLLVFLDDQNARWTGGARYTGTQNAYYNTDSVISITDCFAASAERYPVGLENGTQKRREAFDFTLKYGTQSYALDAIRLTSTSDDKSGLLSFENANPAALYLASGTTKSLTRENFATNYAVLANAGWTRVGNRAVAYGEDENMKVPMILPSSVAEMLDVEYRVLLSSDIHYTLDSLTNGTQNINTKYHGATNADRMQLWVDTVIQEHQKSPVDLLVLAGDVTFDFNKTNTYGEIGTYPTQEQSTLQDFMKNYVSQLPEEIEVFVMPGNHDAWPNDTWKEITGNDREGYVTLGDNLFIFLDTYDEGLVPNYEDDPKYQPIDVEYVQGLMDQYPTHKVWLISHYFNYLGESDAFEALLCDNPRIGGLFAGHTHPATFVELGSSYGNKIVAQTGNFSSNSVYKTTQERLDSFWGLRQLVIGSERAYSDYILADTTMVQGLNAGFAQKRRTTYYVEYFAKNATEDWYQADADVLYVDSVGDLYAFSEACTAQNNYLSGKTVRLKSDIDLAGYRWAQIAQFRGTLDGQGFAIKNWNVNGAKEVAFIKGLNNATVKNIRFVGGKLSGEKGDVACVAISASGTCTFKNIYTEMTVSATGSRASGILSYVNAGAKASFESCVSNCTLSGDRAGGLVAQVMVNSNVEMTDCAFIGDLSNAGKWSSGLTGLTTGSVTLTRCVSLGKGSANTESGLLVFLDDQNARWSGGARYTGTKNGYYNTDSVISITDCFAASAERYPVGLENSSQKRREAFDFTLQYGTQSYALDAIRLTSASDDKSVLLSFENANPTALYLASGTTKSLTRENFATNYAVLVNAGWTAIAGETVAYGDEAGMTLPLILPKAIAQMWDGSFNTPVSSQFWQTKKNGSTYDMRFVSTVNFDDLTDYAKVGFEVSVKVKGAQSYLLDREVLSTSKVLTSILADGSTVSASSIGADYIYALQIRGFKVDAEYEITLVSFAETADGTVIYNYGNEITMTVKNGESVSE